MRLIAILLLVMASGCWGQSIGSNVTVSYCDSKDHCIPANEFLAQNHVTLSSPVSSGDHDCSPTPGKPGFLTCGPQPKPLKNGPVQTGPADIDHGVFDVAPSKPLKCGKWEHVIDGKCVADPLLLTNKPPPLPIKCNKYEHGEWGYDRQWNLEQQCKPDMHSLTEKEWQDLMDRLAHLEFAMKCQTQGCTMEEIRNRWKAKP